MEKSIGETNSMNTFDQEAELDQEEEQYIREFFVDIVRHNLYPPTLDRNKYRLIRNKFSDDLEAATYIYLLIKQDLDMKMCFYLEGLATVVVAAVAAAVAVAASQNTQTNPPRDEEEAIG